VVTFFLLASGPPLLAKIVGAVAGTSVRTALSTVEAIRRKLGRYYTTVAVINLGLGTVTAIVMGLLGMPTPLLWGTIAATFNSVPYFGSACTLLILTGVALVTFDSLGHVAAVVGSFLALATLEGQVVQPLFVGRRLELRPLAVLLGVWLLGALWGVVGIYPGSADTTDREGRAEHNARGQGVADPARRGRALRSDVAWACGDEERDCISERSAPARRRAYCRADHAFRSRAAEPWPPSA
jgi:hypothetical protein